VEVHNKNKKGAKLYYDSDAQVWNPKRVYQGEREKEREID